MNDIPEHVRVEISAQAVRQAAKQLLQDALKQPLSLFGQVDHFIDWLYDNFTIAESKEFTRKWVDKLSVETVNSLDLPMPSLSESEIAQLASDNLDDATIKELAEDCGFTVINTHKDIVNAVLRELDENEKENLIKELTF